MALPKFYKVCQDQQGNIVPQVLGSVYNHGTSVLASLYQDDAGTLPLSNPMTSDVQYGSFKFYVNPGHYDLTFTKPGYTFEPIADFQVPEDTVTLGTIAVQDAHAVNITGGSVSGVSITGGSASGLTSLGVAGNATIGGALAVTGSGTFGDTTTTRNNLGLGTLATQNANAVSISGGAITGLSGFGVSGNAAITGTANIAAAAQSGYDLSTNRLHVAGIAQFAGLAGFGLAPVAGFAIYTNTLQTHLGGPTGVGVAPQGGFELATNRFYAAGTSYFANPVSIQMGLGPGAVSLETNQGVMIHGNLALGIANINLAAFNLHCNGTAGKPSGGSWADTASSAQYKADRQPLPDALTTVRALQGYVYTHTHPTHAGLGPEWGFVAEEVEGIVPHWVLTTQVGDLTIAEQGATALLVEALKILDTRLTALEGAGS